MNNIKEQIMQQDNAEKIRELADQIAMYISQRKRVELSPSRSGFKMYVCNPEHIKLEHKKSWKERG